MSEDIKAEIRDAIYPVLDPHMGISVIEMGIVQSIDVNDGVAEIVIKPTNPACMSITRVAVQVKELAGRVEGVDKVHVTIIEHAMADTLNEMLNRN
jgi:metal-sulfur cluster biosynthetic enzyme